MKAIDLINKLQELDPQTEIFVNDRFDGDFVNRHFNLTRLLVHYNDRYDHQLKSSEEKISNIHVWCLI